MSNLKAFLNENAIKRENVKVVVSDRFVNEKNQPVEWELSVLDNAQYEELVNECKKRVPINGDHRQTTIETDVNKLVDLLISTCTVYPNLNDVELQDSYGTIGDIATVKAMLTPGEYATLSASVQQCLGFSVDMNDKVKEAKN